MAKLFGSSSNVSGHGKYFEIRCKGNPDLRLNVMEGSMSPGTGVNVWPDHSGDNQVWYEDPLTGTLRCMQTNLCLDVDGENFARMEPYQKTNPNQKWRFNRVKGVLENILNPLRVLGADGSGKVSGALVRVQDFFNDPGQKWTIECKPPKFFRLKSDFGTSIRIMELVGGKGKTGSKVVVNKSTAKITDGQLWFENHMGNVASKANEKLTLDGSNYHVALGEFKEDKVKHFWVIIGDKIVNRDDHNEVLEVRDGRDEDGTPVVVGQYKGEGYQYFKVDYV